MPEKFASVPSPEPTYGARQLAKATAEQNAIELRKVVALETIAAEFQRFNDRKARRELHIAYNAARATEESNRRRAMIPWQNRSAAAQWIDQENGVQPPDVPVGVTDPETGHYRPATPEGWEVLATQLSRLLDPAPEITRWRETGNPLPPT